MKNSLNDENILKIADKIISNYKLCDNCFGRFFAKIDYGITNDVRGENLRNNLKKLKKNKICDCWLCIGLIDEINHFADLIKTKLEGYEFKSFLVGSKIDEDILEREIDIINFSNTEHSESIKTEINREIGKILESDLKKEVDFEKPTIMAVIDTSFDNVNLQISSLYIYGRYKKYKRDIPQTKWFCKICYGKGCKRCNYTGKLYDSSVEELISKNFLDITNGEDESFHGSGREDVDARMLGNGRPFVLEIKNPKIRKLDFTKIEKKINEQNKDIIEICNLRYSDKEEINRIKHANFKKTYRVVLKASKILNNEKLKKAAISLGGRKIGQFTPSRVAHRRAEMVREKHIYDCRVESVDGDMATLIIEAESGTYIKELISGDGGKTQPNLSEIVGIPCQVAELDVINIQGE